MKKPWVFAIGLGVGTLVGVVGHMAWTFADGLGDSLAAVANSSAAVTYMEITIGELEYESDLMRALAVYGLEGTDKQQLLNALEQMPNVSAPYDTSGSEVLVQYDYFSPSFLVFENDQLAWITNHCERNATDATVCRTTGAN
ncbi:hypothetical protein [Pseudaestuariivita rosea]|uniref:hypothetical protein n=1 Tax=Pseudaestuariivita rosea TaxID=2763263 RepID=UPI001ABB327D|nr:hypothetical protein [Pseudaestuariivita rosea]